MIPFGLPFFASHVSTTPFNFVQNATRHTFTFSTTEGVKVVTIAGTFNGWDKKATPLTPTGDGKTWTVTLSLKPGRYQYKFVLEDNKWVTDPNAPAMSDGNGNTNSILLLAPPDYEKPASPNDGEIATSALEHSTALPYLNYDRGKLTLSLRVRPNDVSEVRVGIRGMGSIPMTGVDTDEFYRLYTARIPWDRKTDLDYHFELADGGKAFVYGPAGLDKTGEFHLEAKTFKPFEVPAWVEKSIFYQIFPDRFANGESGNDPKDVMPWGAVPTYSNRFGGDVAGVRQHLDYLSDLGVNAIYFNPIFKSPSNHRYETDDYLTVDPEFGTNDDFAALTKELKGRGIRTVLDGVFNHTSTRFFAFHDVALNGAKSKYTHWYTFQGFPVRTQPQPNYVAWFGFPSMPKLNHENPEVRDYLLGVPKFWAQRAEIAGWRLDVANEVPSDYWQAFRKVVKGLNGENWILGEEWGDASKWLQGDQWDASMNYPFRGAVLSFVGKDGSGKPSDLMAGLMSAYSRYAPQVSRNQLNMLSSHDTPRILTLCGNDRELADMAAVILLTWAGAPSIYYGDEIAMEGDKDPDNRRCMDWTAAAAPNATRDLYKKLIAIRKATPVLQSGDPLPLLADDKSLTAAYARILDDQAAIVALNRDRVAHEVAIPLDRLPSGISFINALDGKAVSASADGRILISVAPKGAAVLIPVSGTSRHARLRSAKAPTQQHSIPSLSHR